MRDGEAGGCCVRKHRASGPKTLTCLQRVPEGLLCRAAHDPRRLSRGLRRRKDQEEPIVVRIPLGLIPGNRQFNRELTPYQRGVAIGMTFKGAKSSEIEAPSSLPTYTMQASPSLELVHLSAILMPMNVTYHAIFVKTLKILMHKFKKHVE